MQQLRIPLFFFLLGLLWAITSDPVITFLNARFAFHFLDTVRSFNDIIFVCIATVLLYFVMKWEGEKRKLTQTQYQSLFKKNPNPMWVYDIKTLRFIEVNEAALLKYQYSRTEFLAMTLRDIRPVEDHGKLETAVNADESAITDAALWEHLTKSGERIIVSVSAQRIVFNGILCGLVMITDVTEVVTSKRQLEHAVTKEQQLNETLAEKIAVINEAHRESHRMGEIINKISNLVVIVTKTGRIAWVNAAFIQHTGYQLAEAAGKRPGELLFGPETDDSAVAGLVAAMKKKQFFSTEIINYTKAKVPYWTKLNISPIFDSEGTFEFFVSVEHDISEQKEKERLLLEQYQVFRQLAWSASHETRRPLASILALLALLDTETSESERAVCLTHLQQCAQELDEMIIQNTAKIISLENAITPFAKHQ